MSPPSRALALAWPRIDADPVAAGVLVLVVTALALGYFAVHVWPGRVWPGRRGSGAGRAPSGDSNVGPVAAPAAAPGGDEGQR